MVCRKQPKPFFESELILSYVFLWKIAPVTGLMPLNARQNILLG